jgi:hypothetical protein
MFPRNARTRDGLSSWCASCHATAQRGYRRKRRVEALLAEAAELERRADAADGWQARSWRSTADAVRRRAERELQVCCRQQVRRSNGVTGRATSGIGKRGPAGWRQDSRLAADAGSRSPPTSPSTSTTPTIAPAISGRLTAPATGGRRRIGSPSRRLATPGCGDPGRVRLFAGLAPPCGKPLTRARKPRIPRAPPFHFLDKVGETCE